MLACALFLAGASEEAGGQDGGIAEEVGLACWYGPEFHGRKTASGAVFDQHELTAAHPSLPLGTKAEVTNIENGRRVTVTINDRGPRGGIRIIDLSREAAHQLDMLDRGAAQVKILVRPAVLQLRMQDSSRSPRNE
jgi:rare lipoprotein A